MPIDDNLPDLNIDSGHVSDSFIRGKQGPKDHGSPLVQKIEIGGQAGWLETEVDQHGNVGDTDFFPDKR